MLGLFSCSQTTGKGVSQALMCPGVLLLSFNPSPVSSGSPHSRGTSGVLKCPSSLLFVTVVGKKPQPEHLHTPCSLIIPLKPSQTPQQNPLSFPKATFHIKDVELGLAMAALVTQKLSQLFTHAGLPRLLGPPAPGTVSSAEVPPVFWKPYIHGGYRPLRRPWRYYFCTLFQQHNEAINVWSHLAAALALLLRLQLLWQRVDFGQDAHARPLLLILAASITYLTFSSLAHLLQAKSEFWHYSFFFLDYVGVAVYQYGSALGHFYYAIEPGWHRRVRGFFLPLAAALAWLSCAGSCYAKFRFHPRCPLPGRLCQELPSGLAYALDISPVLHRICTAARPDPALPYHQGQVLFFLLAAFFFSHPYPEKWFPGKCHFVGQSHQIFHVLLVLCTLAQIEAVVLDYEGRREIYSSLQGGPAHDFSALFLVTVACSVLTATYMARRVKNELGLKEE